MKVAKVKEIVSKTLLKKVEDKRKLNRMLESHNFDLFIISVILMDAFVLGLLASDVFDVYSAHILFLLDKLFMGIFIMEMILKIYAYRKGFFKNGWNVFDFVVIAVSSVPYASSLIVLRTFRVFRLFKFLDHFPSLDHLVDTFVKLIPNFVSFLAVQAVIFYSFAVIGVSLYGDVFKDFSTLGSALFVLVQAFTLDGWASSIARPVMMVFPDAWLYFTSFVFISFLAVVSFLVNAVVTITKMFEK